MFKDRALKRELDIAQREFLRAAAPLAARCFADRAEDLLLADEAALAELGPRRAATLRNELRALTGSFEKEPSPWDARRWPHTQRKSFTRSFRCWDHRYVQARSAEWLSERSPIKLPLAIRARIRPMRGATTARKHGMSGVQGALLEIGMGAAFNAFSAARSARANARLNKLSAHRTHEPTPAMIAAEDRYNELLAELRPLHEDPVEKARLEREARRRAKKARRDARAAEGQQPKEAAARRAQAARDAFRDP